MNFTHFFSALALTFSSLSGLWAHGGFYAEEDEDPNVIRYIETYKHIAIEEMRLHGIPASIKLAQAIIESTFGTSPLALEANNHFGIKCYGNWTGESYYKQSKEHERGTIRSRAACFRKYSSPEESFRDHSTNLRSKSVYQWIFELNTLDYQQWARGLQRSGYATDPEYAQYIIRCIEKYGLDKLDRLDAQPDANNSLYSKNWNQGEQVNIGEIKSYIGDLERVVFQAEAHQKELSEEQKELREELAQQRRGNKSDMQALQARIEALEKLIADQERMILSLQARLAKVEQVQSSILRSDPLSSFFHEDGREKQVQDLFPRMQTNAQAVFYVSGRRAVALEAGMTLLGLAHAHNLNYRDLLKYNDIEDDLMPMPENCYIFLESKSNYYNEAGDKYTHQVLPGETIFSIAQRYGVKLHKLYHRNKLKRNEEPEVGEFIFINSDNKQKPRLRRNEPNRVGSFGGGGTGPR